MVNLADDDKVVSFKKAYDQGRYSIDSEKYLVEIENMHITRNVRTLDADSIVREIPKVIEAIAQNQAVRSRIVEIKMKATRVSTKLKFKKETLINYLSVRYKEELRSQKGTQSERNALIQEVFSFTTPSFTELQVLTDFCDLVINDIDQAAWSLKSIIDCLKILDEAKGIVS